MSSLTGSSISGTYDQLLALPSGGGNDSTLVPITDGNGGTTFALQISTAGIKSTGTLVVNGISTLTGNVTTAGILDITNVAAASDFTGDTGALRCEGGASIAGKLYVNSQTYINNHLYLENDGAQIHMGAGGDGDVHLEHYLNNGLFIVAATDKTDNTAVNLSLYHTTSGTAANGIGNNIEFRCESAAGTVRQHGHLRMLMVDATNGAEETDFTVSLMHDGASTSEKMRVTSDGKVGIGTTTPDTTLHVAGSFAASGPSEAAIAMDSSTSPSVAGGNIFTNGHAVTITDFDDGVIGQVIYVYSGAAVVFDDGAGNLKCGNGNITTASGDVTTWVKFANDWHLVSWKDQSAALNSGGF